MVDLAEALTGGAEEREDVSVLGDVAGDEDDGRGVGEGFEEGFGGGGVDVAEDNGAAEGVGELDGGGAYEGEWSVRSDCR